MSDKIEKIIDALRKKILDAAIRGQLVPQNPDDEPASALVERVARERECLIKEKKIKNPKNTSRIFRRDGHFYESINGGEPTCIDEEIPFEIPDSWEWCRLEDFCLYGEAPSIKVNECTPETWVLDLEDIVAHAGRISKRITASERPSSSNKYSFDRGSVLYSKLRPYLNKVIVAEEPGCCTTEIIPIRLFAGVSPYYLQNLLMSPLFVEEINNEAYGVKMPRSDTKLVKSFLIPVPPIQEQQRIVGGLDAQNEKLNTLQLSRMRYMRILEETPTSLRQQLIQAAIQGLLVPQNPNDEPASKLLERITEERTAKLGKKAAKSMSRIVRRGGKTYELFPDGSEKDISDEIPFEIPSSWEWARLSTLLESCSTGPFGSMLHKSDYVDFLKGIPLINPTNIKEGIICSLGIQKVSEEKADCLAKYRLKEGDIILARRGDLSKCAVITKAESKWLCGTGSFFLHLTMIENAYFCCVYSSQYTQSILLGDSVGSTMQNLNQSVLNNLLMPIPPLQEQHRIVEKLDALLKLV